MVQVCLWCVYVCVCVCGVHVCVSWCSAIFAFEPAARPSHPLHYERFLLPFSGSHDNPHGERHTVCVGMYCMRDGMNQTHGEWHTVELFACFGVCACVLSF